MIVRKIELDEKTGQVGSRTRKSRGSTASATTSVAAFKPSVRPFALPFLLSAQPRFVLRILNSLYLSFGGEQ